MSYSHLRTAAHCYGRPPPALILHWLRPQHQLSNIMTRRVGNTTPPPPPPPVGIFNIDGLPRVSSLAGM